MVEQIKQVESSGDPEARNPKSTATGLFGFVDNTWVEQAREALPEAEGMTREQILELRRDPDMQQTVMEHWTQGNVDVLEAAGHETSPANIYTVHFAGRSGGIDVLNADESAPLSSVLSKDAMEANEDIEFRDRKFADWTVADFRAWAKEKMGE